MDSGVIVAGGRSTRFGDTDKAVAELAGTPMIRRVADRITPVVDEIVVNCRAGQRAAIAAALDGVAVTVSFALDPEPDLGPAAGIATGLRAVEGDYAFVAACDMPFVDPGLVAYLFDRAAGHEAAVPRTDGWYQTTHAVYHAVAMAEACGRALDDGERRVAAALSRLDYATVGREEIAARASMATFENLNTREEFAAAGDRLD